MHREKVINIFEKAEFPEIAGADDSLLQRIKRDAQSRMQPKAGAYRFRSITLAYGAAAASIVLILAVLLVRYFPSGLVDRQGMQCTFSFGEVQVKSISGRRPAVAGMRIHPDDIVSTGEKSFADLIYGDDIKIRIKEKTVLKAGEIVREGGLRFSTEISKGKALLDFRKLSRNDNITIKTPTSVAGVRGTRFGVLVRDDRSVRYEVIEGKISVRNRLQLDPQLLENKDVRNFARKLDESLEEKAVVVGEDQVCEVKSRGNEELNKAVNDIVGKSGPSALSDPTAEKIIDKAEEAAAPMVYTVTTSKPELMAELKDFAEDLSSRKGKENSVTATITAEPDRTMIMIDGKLIGYGKVTLDVPEGRHIMEFSAPGFETRRREVELTRKSSVLAVALEKTRGMGFDYAQWSSRVNSSYLIADQRLPLLISVGPNGRVDAILNSRLNWSFNGRSNIGSIPVLHRGRMYLTTVDERVIALSLSDGRLLWSVKIEGGLHFGTRLVVQDNYIFAATASGNLYKLNEYGAVIWKLRLPAGIYATPATDGNFIFVPLQDGNVYAVDAKLHIIVMKIPSGKIVGSTILLRNGRLYAAAFDGRIICHDYVRDEPVWHYRAGSRIITDMVMDANSLYVTAANGDVLRLSADGALVWKLNVGGTIEKTPAIENENFFVLARKAFYVIDRDSGRVRWSYVLPSDAMTNIAFSANNAYFGTRDKGIIAIKK